MGREIRTLVHYCWNVNGAATVENILEVPQKAKPSITIRPSNPTPSHIPKRIKINCSKTSTEMFMASLIIIAKSRNNTNVHKLMIE